MGWEQQQLLQLVGVASVAVVVSSGAYKQQVLGKGCHCFHRDSVVSGIG